MLDSIILPDIHPLPRWEYNIQNFSFLSIKALTLSLLDWPKPAPFILDNTINTCIKEPMIFGDRLKWFLYMYIGCIVRNQPKEVLKIISDIVYSIYLKIVLISELLTLTGLIITLNTN